MNPIDRMQTTRVEIPLPGGDVRLLTITGGGAESTARLLMNSYLGGQGLVTSLPSTNAEEVLPLPVMNFSQPTKKAAVINQDEDEDDAEEVLEVPVLNFARKAA